MITARQTRAARALPGLDQRALAEPSGLSLPIVECMEAGDGVIRGTMDSLTKPTAVLRAAGIELIGDGASSQRTGGGVRLKAARP